jgi:hypothetical protein
MWARRDMLRVGGVGAVGLSLPGLLRAEQEKSNRISAAADSCIIIYLNGGPSHLDMWDMKPDAPAELRGEFRPIETSQSGVLVSEHLPELAQSMHRATLVRSMQHSVNNSHAAAVYAAMTGHDRGEMGGGAKPDDHPSPGAVLAKLRPSPADRLPYVTLPYKTKEGAAGPLQPGFLAGFIGAGYDPFWVLDDPNSTNFRVRNLALPGNISQDRMTERSRLLTSLDRGLGRQTDRSLEAIDDFQRRAFELLTSNAAQKAFRIDAEPDALRDKYGRNIYGQSVLLARRLIEAGTRVVTMSWAPDANATWDTHGGNFTKLKNTLLPQFDTACSGLIEDLADRGRLDRTLVAVLGDFGRTPKINGNAGRDHWNGCYTVMLAGGGVKAGSVYGSSDRIGAQPATNRASPGDVVSTMYRLLGVDHEHLLYDSLARPHQVVPEGRVIRELIG